MAAKSEASSKIESTDHFPAGLTLEEVLEPRERFDFRGVRVEREGIRVALAEGRRTAGRVGEAVGGNEEVEMAGKRVEGGKRERDETVASRQVVRRHDPRDKIPMKRPAKKIGAIFGLGNVELENRGIDSHGGEDGLVVNRG